MVKRVWLTIITLFITITLFVLPTIQTYKYPNIDGQRIYGFPFIFYSIGGITGLSSFSLINLVIDLLFLILVPYIVYIISPKIIKK